MPTFEDVAALALELSELQRSTPCGTPALEVGRRGGLMSRLREGGGPVLQLDPHERRALLEERPDVCYTTPHDEAAPYVPVRLEVADRGELGEFVSEAWRALEQRRALLAHEPAWPGRERLERRGAPR